MRSLVTQFRASDHYRVLQSYRQVLENGRKVRFSEDETIDQLVSRYYFMYPLQIHCSQASSYRGVKQEIYRYLTDSLQYSPCPDYGKHQFNYWLEERLGATLHQFDRLQPSPHLRVKTGVQLIADLLCCPQLRGLPAAYPYSSDHAGQRNHLFSKCGWLVKGATHKNTFMPWLSQCDC